MANEPIELPKEIFVMHGLWYFWKETWARYQGPFVSREACEIAFTEYCKSLG